MVAPLQSEVVTFSSTDLTLHLQFGGSGLNHALGVEDKVIQFQGSTTSDFTLREVHF